MSGAGGGKRPPGGDSPPGPPEKKSKKEEKTTTTLIEPIRIAGVSSTVGLGFGSLSSPQSDHVRIIYSPKHHPRLHYSSLSLFVCAGGDGHEGPSVQE